MIYCGQLNMSFETKEGLFKELRLNHDEIISIKKAQVYKSHEKGLGLTAKPLDYLKLNTQVKDIPLDEDYYYIAVNSSRILDSHLDVHLDGNWNKTVKEQQGEVYLLDTHEVSLGTTLVRKEHIEIFTAIIPFSMLGKSYEGDTYTLIYKIRKDKIRNKDAKDWLDSGDAVEASVRMQYMDIVFALNSDDKEDVKFKKNFDDLYPLIANKADFDSEILFFWGVKQAKNILESSLVLAASNPVTGQISTQNKIYEPDNSTRTKEPDNSTRIDYEYLIKNFKL